MPFCFLYNALAFNQPCICAELIGEEIYDEFDPQGAQGDPYEVPPQVQDSVKVPESIAATPPEQPIAPSPIPASLRGLGHLGFLRSRSAPPVPRDPESHDTATAGSKLAAATTEVIQEHHHHQGHHTHPIMEGGHTFMQATPPSSSLVMTAATAAAPPATLKVPAPTPGHAIPIEAVILGRGRRPVSSAGHGTGSLAGLGASASLGADALPVQVPSRAASMAGKGSKFKSSPLGEGIIVAEKANEDGAGAKGMDGGRR